MNSYNRRPRNDPFSNTYNPGWRDHPNFSWKNNNQFQNFQPKPATTLEDTVKMLARNTVQFQQTTNSTLQQHSAALTKMETQLGQIADALSQREAGKFPSQPVILQRNQEQAKAVPLKKRMRNQMTIQVMPLFRMKLQVFTRPKNLTLLQSHFWKTCQKQAG
ncbi:unnamed protein product [Prunus brigantina]